MAAQEAARRRRRRRLGTEDLLSGLAEANGASSSQALASLGVTVADIDIRVRRGGWRASPGHIPLAADARFAIEAAVREADIHGEVKSAAPTCCWAWLPSGMVTAAGSFLSSA